MTQAPASAPDVFDALRSPARRDDVLGWWTEPVRELDDGSWLLTGYDAASFALHRPELVSAAPREIDGAPDSVLRRPGASVLLFTEPPEHTRLRRVLAAGLTLDPAPFAAALGAGLAVVADRPGDLVADVLAPALDHALGSLLGLPDEQVARHRAWARHASDVLDPGASAALVEQAGASGLRAMVDMTRTLRRGAGGLVGHLARAVDSGDLDEAEAVANLVSLISAAVDTTVGLLTSLVLHLDRQPAAVSVLRDQPSLHEPFLEEVTRLETPVQLVTRRCREAVAAPFGTMPTGANVLVVLASANRDGAVFDRPDTVGLDATRPHLGYGAGLHRCLGAPMARRYGAAALPLLLRHWDRFDVHAGDAVARRHPVFRAHDSIPTSPRRISR